MSRVAFLFLVFATSASSVGRCNDESKREILSQISATQSQAINKISSLAFVIVERIKSATGTQERNYHVYWNKDGTFLVEQADQESGTATGAISRLHPKCLFGGEFSTLGDQTNVANGRFVFESLESYLSSDPQAFDSRVFVGRDTSDNGDYHVTVRYSATGLDDIFVVSHYSRENRFFPVRIVQRKGKTLEESQVLQEKLFAYSTVGDLIVPKLVIWKGLERPDEETRFVITRLHPNVPQDSDKIETIDDLDPELWKR